MVSTKHAISNLPTHLPAEMKLSVIVKCLIVTLLVCMRYAKRPSGGEPGLKKLKSYSSDNVSKLTLPGRTVVVPTKKEPVATSAVKGLRKFGSKLLKSAKKVTKTVSSLNRDIKAYFSSDFEVLLLRMTQPTEEKTNPGDIARFLATTNTFIYNDDVASDSNTYRITLRKIWAKVSEKDPRTVAKALHILHTLLVSSKTKNASLYLKLIRRMSKQVDKRVGAKYFDVKVLRRMDQGVTDEDKLLAAYIKNLFEYVTLRGKTTTAHFDEVKAIGFKQNARDIMTELDKADKLIDAALECSTGLDAGCEVVAASLSLVAQDLRELFDLYASKALFVLQEHEVGDMFDDWGEQELGAALKTLKEGYESRYEKVASFLSEVADLAELFNEEAPATTLQHPKNLLHQFK